MAGLARALKTNIMADLDLKGLAQILKSRGRKGDTILAHISPAEAKLLKKRGGSGKSNPETGLPEFALEGDPDSVSQSFTQPTYVPPSTPQGMDTYEPGLRQLTPTSASDAAQYQGNQAFPPVSAPQENLGFGGYNTGYFTGQEGAQPQGQAPVVPTTAPLTVSSAGQSAITAPVDPAADTQKQTADTQKQNPSWWSRTQDSALKAIQDPSNLLKLGLGAGTLGLGLSQQSAARRQAAQTQAQYAALGAPFQQRGQEMINAAQQGVLTPQSQQAYQAAQAQMNQSVSNQGGVGAQQAAAQLGNVYNNLINNQMTLGMSTVQIGDTYATQGIQAGLQANQQLQAMTQNYYATMMRMLVPATAPTRPTP